MSLVVVVCLVVLVAAMQLLLPPQQKKHLRYHYDLDRTLAEPNEPITLTSQVSNLGSLPIAYVGLAEYLTNEISLCDGETLETRLGEFRTNYAASLLPHRKFSVQLRFSLPARGVYQLGKYYLENGDFLGITSQTQSGKLDRPIVIMPERSHSQQALRVLGGYLGDVSVRRFNMEDPILTVGCRDYTGSEPMKQIAWTQTARTGRMQVKVFDHTVEASATVLLNTENGDAEALESCFRLVRTVCEQLEKSHISYDFYTNGDIRTPLAELSWLAQGLGRRHFETIMYGLGASRCLCLGSFALLVDRCLRKRKSNHAYILITPKLTADDRSQLARLRASSDYDICILTADMEGGEAA